MTISLESIRDCFEGAVPSALATVNNQGIPNVVYISQVEYVDAEHIALTFQFFNKTHHNIQENPQATLRVVDPYRGNNYLLSLRYLHTETLGPLFEKMKAKLAGIASHTGMGNVFKLLGADVYRVEQITALNNHTRSIKPPKPAYLPRLRLAAQAVSRCDELDALVDTCLSQLAQQFGIGHAMFLIMDETESYLFTCGSMGYEQSGVGSEIPVGEGIIGVAAREKTAIRISHMTSEYTYNNAIREQLEQAGLQHRLESRIPLPGLPHSRSQMALPLVNNGRMLGVIYVESERDLAFDYDDENILETFALLIAAQMQGLVNKPPEIIDEKDCTLTSNEPLSGEPQPVQFYAADQSIFIADDYVIKGVAGAILWFVLREYCQRGRTQFTNRELRLNDQLGLPAVADNLEARLTLLQKRLAERQAAVQMHKCGRGRFSIDVKAPLTCLPET